MEQLLPLWNVEGCVAGDARILIGSSCNLWRPPLPPTIISENTLVRQFEVVASDSNIIISPIPLL